jgi:Domain of unknown function (DUF6249)
MKRSAVLYTLVSLVAAILMQQTLAQAPNTAPLEEPRASTSAVDEGFTPKRDVLITAPQTQPYSQGAELANLQEQLKWAEQRASTAEDQARSAQRNIPLLILLVLFSLPIAFAAGVFFARYRNYQNLNQTLRSLMEKGTAIPPELLTPRGPTAPPMSDFRKGLLLVWTGIGATFLLGIVLTGSRAWSLGLIPIFTGVAYLVLWRLERRKEAV